MSVNIHTHSRSPDYLSCVQDGYSNTAEFKAIIIEFAESKQITLRLSRLYQIE